MPGATPGLPIAVALSAALLIQGIPMMYNNTKIKISVPFHEDLFLGSTLCIDMWTDDYYELLALIGDDYE